MYVNMFSRAGVPSALHEEVLLEAEEEEEEDEGEGAEECVGEYVEF